MGSLKNLFPPGSSGLFGGAPRRDALGFPETIFDHLTLPEAVPEAPPPLTLAQKFGNVYRNIEQAPAIAANYYSPGGAEILSEGLNPQPPSMAQLVESGAQSPDELASDTYGQAVARNLGGAVAELGASPTNAALLLATGGAGTLGESLGMRAVPDLGTLAAGGSRAAQLGQRAISLGFAGSMIPGAAEKLAQAEAQREQEGFSPRVAGAFAGAGLEAGFAGLAGAHGVSPFEAPRTLREKFAAQEQTVAPDLVPGSASRVPQSAPIIQRPAFLDEVDRQAPPIPPGPELGYGRGGIPAGQPLDFENAVAQSLMAQPGAPRLNDYASPESLGLRPLESVVEENVRRRLRNQGLADQQSLASLEQQRSQPLNDAIQASVAGNIPAPPRLGPPAFGPPRPPVIPGLGREFNLSPEAYRSAVQSEAPSTLRGQPAPPDASLGEAVANVAPQGQVAPPAAIPERRGAGRKDVETLLQGLPPEKADEIRTYLRTDDLTGLKNKAGWDQIVSTVNPETDHVVAVDLKGFKAVNDTYSHDAGNEALQGVAAVVDKHFGEDGARPHGDEFNGVVRNSSPEEAHARAEAFRQDLRNLTVPVHMPDGNVLDIPGFDAHIGVARNAKEADLLANAERVKNGSGREAPPANPDLGGAESSPAGGLGEGRQNPPQQLAEPSFREWLGNSRVPDDPNYIRGLRDQYLKEYPNADREQFVRGLGPKSSPFPEPETPHVDARGFQDRAAEEARQIAPDSEVDQDLRDNVAPALARGIDRMQKRGGINSVKPELGLEGVQGDPKTLVTAIKRDADNPKYLEIKEARRLAMADERASFDPSQFEPHGEQPQYAKALPGQRGLPGVAEDIASASEKKKAPEQRSMFGGEMLQSSVTRTTEGREGEGSLFTQDEAARAKAERDAQGGIKFAAGENTTAKNADLRPRIEQVFKGLPVIERQGGFELRTPSGKRILIKPTGEIAFDAKALEKGHGKAAVEKVSSGKEVLAGATFNLGRDSLIHIADHGVLPHESVHVFLDHFASDQERATIQRRFETQAKAEGRAWDEVAADAYNKWFDRPKDVQQSLITRVFQRVRDFVQKVADVVRPSPEGVFRKIESGEGFKRSANEIVPRVAEQQYATAPKAPPQLRPIPDRVSAEEPGPGERKPPKLPINLEHLDLPEELKSKWAEDLAKNKDYYQKLKGHVTGEDVQQASRDLGLSRDQIAGILKGKRPPTKEEFFAARDLLVSERKGLAEAEKSLSAAEAGKADTTLAKQSLAKSAAAYDALLNNFMGKQAEAARTLSFFKLLAHGDIDVSKEGRQVQEAVARITGRTGTLADEVAAKVRDAIRSGDAARITSTIQDAMKAPLKDKIFEAWINGLLSSPSTSVTKGVSDIANLLVKGGERGIASQIDALNERWTGSPRQRFAGEMSAHFGGMKDAIPDALQSFKDAWAERPVGVLGEGDVVEHALRGPAIPGKLGKIVRAGYGGGGSRALRAIDAFSKTLARSSEKHVQALRIAHEESGPGASVGDISKRASEIASTPDDQLTKLLGKEKGQAVLDAMSKFQKNATFTDDFGPAMLAVQQLRKDVPLARYVIPFTKVPWNIARNVYQHTPLNFLNILHKIKSGELKGAAITDELVKPLVGTPLMIAVALKAANGEITGNGPDDTQKRAAWLAAGFQPYSIKIPGGWVSYKKIEPWAGVMGLAADVVEASKEQDSKDKIAHAVAGLQEAFEKKSFLTGLEQIGGLLKDPIQYTKSYAQQMEGTVVPAVFSRAAQAIDPTLRQINGPGLDPLLSRIPFASEKLQPKLGPAGEELQRGGSAVERFASPFTRTEEKQGPVGDVERVLAEVGYSPGKPPQKLALHGQHVDLTPDEQAVYGKADALAAQRIAAIVKSSAFTALPDTEQEGGEQSKEAVLRRIYTKARAQARDRIISTSDFGQRFRTAAQQSRQPHA